MEMLRRTKEYIEHIRAGVREEYAEVEAGDGSAKRELIGAVYGIVLHTVVFPMVSWYFIFSPILIAVLCGVLGIFWVFATISFAKKTLNVYTTYRVMTSKPGTEEYAQEFRIRTYDARRRQCENHLHLLQERLTRLNTYERQIERQRGLSNADYEAMQSLRIVPKDTETFSDKKEVTFREFREWKKRGKGVYNGLQ